ncbi:MAG: class I tRNA ligase family protein, partial [Nanopusillaceae archaeon]
MNSSFEFFKNIEEKWQKIWEEKKCYCPEIDKDKPKFFITVPYPYVSGLLHLGNAYTFARGDFLARYKRLKGFNVLWAQGWHLTGSPIISKAYRLKEGDQKIIKDLKADGIPESDFEKLKSPEGWAIYFMQLNREYFKKFG